MRAAIIALVLAGLAVVSYFVGRSFVKGSQDKKSRDEILERAREIKAQNALERKLKSEVSEPQKESENG